MKRENKSNIHINCMTKGGVGKTTTSNVFSTVLYLSNQDKKINLFELEE